MHHITRMNTFMCQNHSISITSLHCMNTTSALYALFPYKCTTKTKSTPSHQPSVMNEQELPVRKQIRPRPSGFELNLYGQDCTPVTKNSSSERKTKNTQHCQKLKFYQIQINLNINRCFPKQFWCWSWPNELDYSNIPFFVVYGKSPQGITQSCTSLSQPPQPCCPSGWAGGSAGWDYVTVFAELTSSC